MPRISFIPPPMDFNDRGTQLAAPIMSNALRLAETFATDVPRIRMQQEAVAEDQRRYDTKLGFEQADRKRRSDMDMLSGVGEGAGLFERDWYDRDGDGVGDTPLTMTQRGRSGASGASAGRLAMGAGLADEKLALAEGAAFDKDVKASEDSYNRLLEQELSARPTKKQVQEDYEVDATGGIVDLAAEGLDPNRVRTLKKRGATKDGAPIMADLNESDARFRLADARSSAYRRFQGNTPAEAGRDLSRAEQEALRRAGFDLGPRQAEAIGGATQGAEGELGAPGLRMSYSPERRAQATNWLDRMQEVPEETRRAFGKPLDAQLMRYRALLEGGVEPKRAAAAAGIAPQQLAEPSGLAASSRAYDDAGGLTMGAGDAFAEGAAPAEATSPRSASPYPGFQRTDTSASLQQRKIESDATLERLMAIANADPELDPNFTTNAGDRRGVSGIQPTDRLSGVEAVQLMSNPQGIPDFMLPYMGRPPQQFPKGPSIEGAPLAGQRLPGARVDPKTGVAHFRPPFPR